MHPETPVKSSSTNSEPGGPPKVVVVPCQYKTGRTLGTGTYAIVKEAVHIVTGKMYAVKVMNKKLMRGREHLIRREIEILKLVSAGHPHILTLHDYFETQNNLYLVVDLALGGELFERICTKRNYQEKDAAIIVRTIVDGVLYLHSNGIVHRDLKPENLLFRTRADDDDLLIADFGLSRIIDNETLHLLTTTCGTPGYMAPEVFGRNGHGKPVDLWAIGVITYFLLCGYTPFDTEEGPGREVQKIMKAEYAYEPEEYWSLISGTARDFIDRLLVVDPAKRMTAEEALEHPFIKDATLASKGASEGVNTPQPDLLPQVQRSFNARRTLRKAVDVVRLINSLGGHKNWKAWDEHVVGQPHAGHHPNTDDGVTGPLPGI